MSSDARLDRLGLLHLKDKPEQLRAELEERIEQQRREEEVWAEEREKILEQNQQQRGTR